MNAMISFNETYTKLVLHSTESFQKHVTLIIYVGKALAVFQA